MNIKDEVAAGVQTALATLGFGGGKTAPGPGPAAPGGSAASHPASTPEGFSPEQLGVLKAALAAGIDTPEKFTALASAPKAEDHPVLKAALAAGLDTPEKFAQHAGEAKSGQEALKIAREDAELAAVAYYGANAEGLQAAKDQIASETSFSQLNATADKFWAGAPGAARPEKRLSQPSAPSTDATKAATEKAKQLAAEGNTALGANGPSGESFDYYRQYNGKKAEK